MASSATTEPIPDEPPQRAVDALGTLELTFRGIAARFTPIDKLDLDGHPPTAAPRSPTTAPRCARPRARSTTGSSSCRSSRPPSAARSC